MATLERFAVRGERRDGRIGIWVDRGPHVLGGRREDKIAALGIRVRRWVTFHGIALNVDCRLSHFPAIVPPGITPHPSPVTSLADLSIVASLPEVDRALKAALMEVFSHEASCVPLQASA